VTLTAFETPADCLRVFYAKLDYFWNRRIETKARMAPAQFLEKCLNAQQKLSIPTNRIHRL
jgi:hypothetical protein